MAEPKAEPKAAPKGGGFLQFLITLGLILVVLVHPTQVTIKQACKWIATQHEAFKAVVDKVPGVNLTLADVLLWVIFPIWVLNALMYKRREALRLVSVPICFLLIWGVISLIPALKPPGESDLKLPKYQKVGDAQVEATVAGEEQAGKPLTFAKELASYFKELIQYVQYFLIAFLMFATGMTSPRLVKTMAYLFFLMATVVIAVGAFEYLNDHDVTYHGVLMAVVPNPMDIDSTFGFQMEEATAKHIGTKSNRNVLGGYLSLALPLMWGAAIFTRNPLVAVWLILAVATGLAITLSGGAFLAIVVAMLILAAVRSHKLLTITVAVLGCAFLLLFPKMPRHNVDVLFDSVMLSKDKDRFHSLPEPLKGKELEGEGRVQQRYLEWQAALNAIMGNPAFGVGLGGYQGYINRYYEIEPYTVKKPAKNYMEPDANNYYAVIGVELGIPGILAILWILVDAMGQGLRAFTAIPKGFEKGLAVGVCGSMLGFMINSLFTSMIVRGVAIAFVLILALAAAMQLLYSSPQPAGEEGGGEKK